MDARRRKRARAMKDSAMMTTTTRETPRVTPTRETTTMTTSMDESRLENESARRAPTKTTPTTKTKTATKNAAMPMPMTTTTPRTRRAAREMKRRRENEERSALLGTLPEDALRRVCEFLSARELATLERVSSYFYRSARRNDRGMGMCEIVARGRVRREGVGDMPAFYGCARESGEAARRRVERNARRMDGGRVSRKA